MDKIVTADIGGTHARFAFATLDGRKVAALGEPVTLKTADYGSFRLALEAFARESDTALPPGLAIAFAGPVGAEVLKLTNNPWVLRPSSLSAELGLDRLVVVNDFAAIGHAVAALPDDRFRPVAGPEGPLPQEGVISIVGPGTGLGVAALLRLRGGHHVLATEGGHIDFAPLDPIEDRILNHLRKSFRRVSVERLISGRGLVNIYEALAAIEGKPAPIRDERDLWKAAMDGADSLAAAALDRFFLVLGAAAGDIALAQGAGAVVLAGGLGQRLQAHFARSGFHDRFIAKGRFERMMAAMPVRMIDHPQPGLLGAAAAFAVAD